MKSRILAIAALFFVTLAFTYVNTSWNIDPNYSIKFSGKKVAGAFYGLKGSIQFDPAQPEKGSMNVEVPVNTIKTDKSGMDKHAVNSDWLDAAKYPVIRFTSSKISRSTTGYDCQGTMEIHGVKKTVTIPFQFTDQGKKGMFTGKLKVNKNDYGIKGSFMSSFVTVGPDFEVELKVPVNK